ncbi:MAG: preprotein translocase subunit SecG [candidate division WOR-3 bacterium]|nr:preprotein translocase subunit SecG [candidate division WOR-3 bacterium]
MFAFIIFLHILVCIVLIAVVLFQQPQKGGVTSVFGGSESIFGGGGAAPFMTKLTSAIAVLFMITSIVLVLTSAARIKEQLLRTQPTEQTQPRPGGE